MTVWTQLNSSDNWGGTYATPVQPGGVLSGGNLTWTPNTDQVHWCRAVDGHSTGKYYFGTATSGQFGNGQYLGLMKSSSHPVDTICTGFIGCSPNDGGYFNGTQNYVPGGVSGFRFNTTIEVAVNLNTGLFWSRLNITTLAYGLQPWNGSGSADPATGIGGIDMTSLFPLGTMLFPFVQAIAFSGGLPHTANFGGSAFLDAVPSGFTPGWPVSGPSSAIPYVHIIT